MGTWWRCRLGLGELLWSHTSHHQHQQDCLCLIHLLLPMQGLDLGASSYFCPSYVPWLGIHTGNGEHPWGAAGLCGTVGFCLFTDCDVVLCRACQAFLVCWDAR